MGKITMAMKEKGESTRITLHEEEQPLVNGDEVANEQKNLIQKAIIPTFQSSAELAKLLPTGTVLAFQLLAPTFSHMGKCDSVSKDITATLLVACGLVCFLSCFTDSFRDKDGKVRYGWVTRRGLLVLDGSPVLPCELAESYKLQIVDFVHAFMSLIVFVAVALFDQNVVSCFCPSPSIEVQEILAALPLGLGVISSMLIVVFPSKRHGFGFPLSSK